MPCLTLTPVRLVLQIHAAGHNVRVMVRIWYSRHCQAGWLHQGGGVLVLHILHKQQAHCTIPWYEAWPLSSSSLRSSHPAACVLLPGWAECLSVVWIHNNTPTAVTACSTIAEPCRHQGNNMQKKRQTHLIHSLLASWRPLRPSITYWSCCSCCCCFKIKRIILKLLFVGCIIYPWQGW